MNIDWVIPCRYVEVHDNLGTIVGAGIDTFWVQAFPAQLQVVLAVRLLATAEEFGEDVPHTAFNRIRNPAGEVLLEVGGEFSVANERPQEDWLNGIIVPSVVIFEAAVEGTYTLVHEVDGSSLSLPIHVVPGPPPGVEWPEEPAED